MLLINAKAGPSQLNGYGLIAQEFISAGTKFWKLHPGFDVIIPEDDFQHLSPTAQNSLRYYAYFCPQRKIYILSSDDDRFMNHSDTPNTQKGNDDDAYVIQDIQKGEELTCNYREYSIYANHFDNASLPLSSGEPVLLDT
jgi:uncharacterized protein